MTGYDWSGLRFWRTAFAVSLLLFLPASCFVGNVVNPSVIPPLIAGLFAGMLVVGGSLYGLQKWNCPRCGSGFAQKPQRPWVAPWSASCSVCGLPEYTPTEADAPPPVAPAPLPPDPIALSTEDVARAKARKRRTRVALLFAIPLLYLTMCRLPPGEIVKSPSGRDVRMLGVMRNKQWTSGQGTAEWLEVEYYSSATDSSELRDVLALAIPMTGQSDSTIRISQVRDDWWLRNLGIKVSSEFSFRRQRDGTWAEGL
jgi:hypothetical protein